MRATIFRVCAVLLLAGIYNVKAVSSTSISFVQVATAVPQSRVSRVNVSYPQTQNAGDLNVVVVGWNDSVASVQSVTDTRGNKYALAIGPLRGIAVTQSIYYAKNIRSGRNTVTVTFSPAAVIPDLRILEYKGANTTSPLDVSAQAKGTSGRYALVSSGSVSTTTSNEIVFAAGTTGGVFTQAGQSFTADVITKAGDIAEQEVVTARGTYSATARLGNYVGQNWVMQMLTLKSKSTAGAGSPPTVTSVTPDSGSSNGGIVVTVNGSNFASGVTVSFGGVLASNVRLVNGNSMTATTPAHTAGPVNIVVSDSNGNGSLSSGFTYTSPAGIQHKVVLSWDASSSANITNYNVYRSTVSGGYYSLIGTAADALTYTDQTVSSGKIYYYVTSAVNKQGMQSNYSNQVAVTVPSP
jgi:hypothetical protein